MKKLIELDIEILMLLHQDPEKRIQALMALDMEVAELPRWLLSFLLALAHTVVFRRERIRIQDIPGLLLSNPALLYATVQTQKPVTLSLFALVLSLLEEHLCTSALAYISRIQRMPYVLTPQGRALYWHLQREYVNGTFIEPEDWVSRIPPTIHDVPASEYPPQALREVVSDLIGVGILEWKRLRCREFPLHVDERWHLIQRYHLATQFEGFWTSQGGRDEISAVEHSIVETLQKG